MALSVNTDALEDTLLCLAPLFTRGADIPRVKFEKSVKEETVHTSTL